MNDFFKTVIEPLNTEFGRVLGMDKTFNLTRKYITVKDKSRTTKLVLCYDQDGNKRFFEESKVKTAEALGLSLRRVG